MWSGAHSHSDRDQCAAHLYHFHLKQTTAVCSSKKKKSQPNKTHVTCNLKVDVCSIYFSLLIYTPLNQWPEITAFPQARRSHKFLTYNTTLFQDRQTVKPCQERVIKKVTLGVTRWCGKALSWCLCSPPRQGKVSGSPGWIWGVPLQPDKADLDHNPLPSYRLHETPPVRGTTLRTLRPDPPSLPILLFAFRSDVEFNGTV